MSGDIFGHHKGEGNATDILWVELRDAANLSTMHRTTPTPTPKSDPVQMQVVLRLRKPGLSQSYWSHFSCSKWFVSNQVK